MSDSQSTVYDYAVNETVELRLLAEWDWRPVPLPWLYSGTAGPGRARSLLGCRQFHFGHSVRGCRWSSERSPDAAEKRLGDPRLLGS